jgi:hypothetical protein
VGGLASWHTQSHRPAADCGEFLDQFVFVDIQRCTGGRTSEPGEKGTDLDDTRIF